MHENLVGTTSMPQRAFRGEAGRRQTQAPRLLGSSFGPKILENREKHHLEKT